MKASLAMVEVTDYITEIVATLFGWKAPQNPDPEKFYVVYVDKDGKDVTSEDFDSLEIEPIYLNGHTYSQVNLWGDGTLEFQDETGESTNWAEFSDTFITRIKEHVEAVVEKRKG